MTDTTPLWLLAIFAGAAWVTLGCIAVVSMIRDDDFDLQDQWGAALEWVADRAAQCWQLVWQPVCATKLLVTDPNTFERWLAEVQRPPTPATALVPPPNSRSCEAFAEPMDEELIAELHIAWAPNELSWRGVYPQLQRRWAADVVQHRRQTAWPRLRLVLRVIAGGDVSPAQPESDLVLPSVHEVSSAPGADGSESTHHGAERGEDREKRVHSAQVIDPSAAHEARASANPEQR